MGILDDNQEDDAVTANRRDVLRANIWKIAEDRNINYADAVIVFAKNVDRSHSTIYSWLSERSDGNKASRPIPPQHFRALIDAELIDPDLDE